MITWPEAIHAELDNAHRLLSDSRDTETAEHIEWLARTLKSVAILAHGEPNAGHIQRRCEGLMVAAKKAANERGAEAARASSRVRRRR